MADATHDLQFEHATYNQAPSGITCGMCQKPITGQYWQWLGRVLCGNCVQQVAALDAHAKSTKTFARAALLASGTALGCGIAYAIFVGLTNIQFALITIGIAFAIATVIRKATHNVSGLRYQVLAVVLTYCAGSMGYAPSLLRGLREPSHHVAKGPHGQALPHITAAIGDDTSDEDPAPADAPTTSKPPSLPLGALVKLGGLLIGFLLAAPFLQATEAPIGLLIVGFGLWEAWRRTKPLPMTVTGPHAVPSAPIPATAAPEMAASSPSP